MADGGNIEIEAGVNAQGKPFCRILLDGEPVGQLTPNQVRRMALQWLTAAEAAEHDSCVFKSLIDPSRYSAEQALEPAQAAAFISQLREYRQKEPTPYTIMDGSIRAEASHG